MDTPVRRALLSLDGLSVGDVLGERFFGLPEEAAQRIAARTVPPGPWRYTDDTEMALGLVECLRGLLHLGGRVLDAKQVGL